MVCRLLFILGFGRVWDSFDFVRVLRCCSELQQGWCFICLFFAIWVVCGILRQFVLIVCRFFGCLVQVVCRIFQIVFWVVCWIRYVLGFGCSSVVLESWFRLCVGFSRFCSCGVLFFLNSSVRDVLFVYFSLFGWCAGFSVSLF